MTKDEARAAMDADTKAKLYELARRMSLEELWRLNEGSLRASAIAQQVMIERFGVEEWRRFDLAVESGRIKIP
jgi:hypothetical protein